jgi:hypothetical protein
VKNWLTEVPKIVYTQLVCSGSFGSIVKEVVQSMMHMKKPCAQRSLTLYKK